MVRPWKAVSSMHCFPRTLPLGDRPKVGFYVEPSGTFGTIVEARTLRNFPFAESASRRVFKFIVKGQVKLSQCERCLPVQMLALALSTTRFECEQAHTSIFTIRISVHF